MSMRKETVLDLAKFVDKGVQVKLTGGRQGTLKGYDQLLNLVLDEAIEFLRDPEDPLKTTDQTRLLGLIVLNKVVRSHGSMFNVFKKSRGRANKISYQRLLFLNFFASAIPILYLYLIFL